MTAQPPLAESMGRDSRSGSLQRLVSRSRELALSYFAAHPEAKADATAKGLVLMREDWRKSHRYEYRDGETKCWVCGESWHAKEMTLYGPTVDG